MNRFQTKYIKIKALSPVHIGTGEELSPFDYVVKGNKLHFIHRDIFIKRLQATQQYDKFLDICSQDNIRKIRDFIANNFSEQDDATQSLSITDEFAKKYKQAENKAEVKAHSHSGVYRDPILPGSSVKGMIRTSYLEFVGKNKKGMHFSEEALLQSQRNDTKTDPFKALKVSDLLLAKGGTEVSVIHNINKKGERVLPVNIEAVCQGSEFVGQITLDAKPNEVKENLTFNNILDAIKEHGESTLTFEKGRFGISLNSENANSMITKLGMHTGRFGMSLNNFRYGGKLAFHPKSRKKEKIVDPETTWEMQGQPIGWIEIIEIDEAEYKSLMQKADELTNEKVESIKAKKTRIEEVAHAEKEAIRKAEEEAEKKAKEEAERIETLANASPKEWVEEWVSGQDKNSISQKIQDDEEDIERRKELVLHFVFSGSAEAKKNLKNYKKQDKKGKLKGVGLKAKEFFPEKFEV